MLFLNQYLSCLSANRISVNALLTEMIYPHFLVEEIKTLGLKGQAALPALGRDIAVGQSLCRDLPIFPPGPCTRRNMIRCRNRNATRGFLRLRSEGGEL